jgi:hypothetical protein
VDLHNVAAGAISAVNPTTTAQWSQSTGNTVGADGTASPAFAAAVAITVQQQALTQADLRHLDMLNIQGVLTKFWMNGALYGVNRLGGQGGDVLVTADGRTWLVSAVLEIWPDWCSVACTLQVNPVQAPTPL